MANNVQVKRKEPLEPATSCSYSKRQRLQEMSSAAFDHEEGYYYSLGDEDMAIPTSEASAHPPLSDSTEREDEKAIVLYQPTGNSSLFSRSPEPPLIRVNPTFFAGLNNVSNHRGVFSHIFETLHIDNEGGATSADSSSENQLAMVPWVPAFTFPPPPIVTEVPNPCSSDQANAAMDEMGIDESGEAEAMEEEKAEAMEEEESSEATILSDSYHSYSSFSQEPWQYCSGMPLLRPAVTPIRWSGL